MQYKTVRAIVVAHVPSFVVAHHEPGLSIYHPIPSLHVLDTDGRDWFVDPETNPLPEPGTQVRVRYRWVWVWFFGWRILRFAPRLVPRQESDQ